MKQDLGLARDLPKTEEMLNVPADQRERYWYDHYYRGNEMRQLTLRAVIMGAVLGMILSLSNLYIGLKIGWGFGVAITACIMSFAIWKTFRTLFPRIFTSDMTILENNCMQSTASSAGQSTGTVLVSAIPAYLIITGHNFSWPVLALFVMCTASLGVFVAIPMKRQMINVEQLRFPSGLAAATTLKSLHDKGKEAMGQAKSLGAAGLAGAILKWLTAGKIPFAIPETLEFPGTQMGLPLSRWTIGFDVSLLMIAAGALIGFKVGWSLLLGAIINYCWLAPFAVNHGAIALEKVGFGPIARWSVWTGVSIMVTSSLLHFATQWRTMGRAFKGLGRLANRLEQSDPLAKIEVPISWFLWGVLFAGVGCILVLDLAFGTHWYMGIIAVLLTFILALVACRATGETDITPVGPMGKITQLLFGVLAPANAVTNLMTAGVTAGAASSSADLLTDLKSGYLLGANPRKQFLAQFFGVFAGLLVVVPVYYLLVPDASVIGTKWAAPSAQVWAAVAKLLSEGFSKLHYTAKWGLLIGSLVGIGLQTVPKLWPKVAKFTPSPMGLGIGMVVPFSNSLGMFIGSVIALGYTKWKPALAERYIIPVSSGAIAGESIIGILTAILIAFGILAA